MEAIILVGVPGAGKTTFYRSHFASSHARICLDELKTRTSERAAVQTCIAAGQSFVVDDTNIRGAERKPFIDAAKAAGYRVVGYVFRLELRAAIKRNSLRTGKAVVPVPAIIRSYKQMEPPTLAEGFDELWAVTIQKDGSSTVGPLK